MKRALFVFVFALLLTSGCGVGMSEPDHVEREAVREWLRKNTDTGKWEEVEWSRPIKDGDYVKIDLVLRTECGGSPELQRRFRTFAIDPNSWKLIDGHSPIN